MGLFSKLFNEFVDVIEWLDSTNDTMVYRFERYGNEIKYGAKLIVRESQFAVFVNEGEVADVLGPGTYELETKNLPVLTTLQNWHHGFQSPFKAEVYFCNTRQFTDLKWGTKQPLMIRDSEFGGMRVRAFGNYSLRIADPLKFIQEIVGTDGVFTTDEVSNQLRNLITSQFATVVGSSGIPVLDMAANYDQLGEYLVARISPEFDEYGLKLTKLLVENISLPPAVSEALDKRTSMGMTGNLDRFLQYQTGVAMETAAGNSAGGASEGIGMGVGLAMANRMSDSVGGGGAQSSSTPPPVPNMVQFHVAKGQASSGPFSVEALAAQVKSGALDADTLVWSPSMTTWRAAGQVQALAELFDQNSAPPPIPS